MWSLWKALSRAATPDLLLPLSDLTPSAAAAKALSQVITLETALVRFHLQGGEVLGGN